MLTDCVSYYNADLLTVTGIRHLLSSEFASYHANYAPLVDDVGTYGIT